MFWKRILESDRPAATIIIRMLVRAVFLLEGMKKVLSVGQGGAGRFARIGIPDPQVMARFVGSIEVLCGLPLLIGLLTRPASLPLIIVIAVAILSTKVPILVKNGFWPMEAEARTDDSMLLGLLFLPLAGAGAWSVDARLPGRPGRGNA
jgi:putative oxidoreductase